MISSGDAYYFKDVKCRSPVVHFLRCAPHHIPVSYEFSSYNQLLSSYKSCMLNEKKIASQQRFELIEEYVVIPSNIYSKLMTKVSQQWITNESQKRHLLSQAWICLVMSVMYVKLKFLLMYCKFLYNNKFNKYLEDYYSHLIT